MRAVKGALRQLDFRRKQVLEKKISIGKSKWKQDIDMLTGKPVKLVMLFSLPLVFGNIFQQLYYITDAVIVGKFINIQALAAVNSCSWVIWLFNAIARDLSSTLSILVSYNVGKDNRDRLKKIVGNAGTLTLILALTLTILVESNLKLIFQIFKVPSEILAMTRDYFFIIFLGIPFIFIYNVAVALLRGIGNSKITLYAISTSTIINVGLDLLFIVGFGWGVKGGAIATVIAQFMAMLIALVPLCKSSMFPRQRSDWKLEQKLMRQIAELWLPMLVNSAVISLGGSLVSSQVNAIGPFFTAGVSSATKIFTLLESVIMTIQTGLSVFIGQNLGAGKIKRVKKGVYQIILVALIITAVLNIFVQIFAPQLANIFLLRTDELYDQTLRVTVTNVRVTTLGMFIMTPMYLYRVAIQTLGHPKYPMYAAFLQLAARAFSIFVLSIYIGEYAYYLATVLAWLVTLPVVAIPYNKNIRDLERRSRPFLE